ncbi:hypothetical protein [Candidatus Spongiisocius sp.]|uniref:hypothetical protein n=1 Tax=Candidatus Spongiisocius sp. TaxID=3101273 RepID=UPI003B5BD71A
MLSLVSAADRWTVSIATSELAEACGVNDFELRAANSRLTDEHLVVERDGVMSGLHRLRSETISEVIHHQPPPRLRDTIARVLDLVADSDLHRFVANLLRDEPSARDTVIESATNGPLHPARFAAYLQGLRLGDFYEVAKAWTEIADKHEVPVSTLPMLFYYTSIGMPIPDILPAEIRRVQEAMNSVSAAASLEDLVAAIGEQVVSRLLASVNTILQATDMFAVLENGNEPLITAIRRVLTEGTPIAATLWSAPVDQLAECIAAARSCHPTVADHLLGLIGGEETVLRRIRAHNPWITELEIRLGDDGPFAFGRFLHVSDTLQQDAQKEAVALGQLLLCCLPHIQSVDIQALAPGNNEMTIGDYSHGVSRLRRQYYQSESGIAWNQARVRAAVSLVGESATARLTEALPLIDQAAYLSHESGTHLVTGRPHRLHSDELAEQIDGLHKAGRSLRPPAGTGQLGDTAISEQATALTNEPLSALILALTGNVLQRLSVPDQYRGLAAYISDTVIGKHLADARNEPWAMLGIYGYPPSLDRLREVLSDIHAVVSELAASAGDLSKVVPSARSGSARDALHRAARTSRLQQRHRIRARKAVLQRKCDATGLTTNVLYRQPRRGVVEFAVTVDLGSLIEWPAALELLDAALRAERPLSEGYVLVPLCEGNTVPSLAMRFNSSLLPYLELGDWATMLPDPAPSELANTFDEALGALQVLSGICHLPEDQQAHDMVLSTALEANSRFTTAQMKLVETPPDPLTDELLGLIHTLAEQVQAELDGTHAFLSLAEQSAMGTYQDERTDVFNTILGARFLTLEWDIDRAKAVALLADLS